MIFGDTYAEKTAIAAWLFINLTEYTADEMRQSVARVSTARKFEPVLLHAIGGTVLDYTDGFDDGCLDSACLIMQRALLVRQAYNMHAHKIDIFGHRLVPLMKAIRDTTPELQVQERTADVIQRARASPYMYFRYDGSIVRQWIRDAGIQDSKAVQDMIIGIEEVGDLFATDNSINTLHCLDVNPFDSVNAGIVTKSAIVRRGKQLIEELTCGRESVWRHEVNEFGNPVLRLSSFSRGRAYSTRVYALDHSYGQSQRVYA